MTIFDRKFKIEIMKKEAIWNPIEVIDGTIIIASLQEQIQVILVSLYFDTLVNIRAGDGDY